MKLLRKLDGFVYDGESVKDALDQAFDRGSIGIFALECIIAEPRANSSGIGKLPNTDPATIIHTSPLTYQSEGIKYAVSTLSEAGLSVGFWCFLGDDDFRYCVSKSDSVENPDIQQAVQKQIQFIVNEFQDNEAFGCTTSISGWLSQEKDHQDLMPLRTEIKKQLQLQVEQETLSPKIAKRLQKMKNWRMELLGSLDEFMPQSEQIIAEQALEELTSFAFQGLVAPEFINRKKPQTPLIFVNTFPDVGTQHLDDECLRFGGILGVKSRKYGTIHLPGAERASAIIGKSEQGKNKDFAIFRCGSPTGSPTAISYGKTIRKSV